MKMYIFLKKLKANMSMSSLDVPKVDVLIFSSATIQFRKKIKVKKLKESDIKRLISN